MACSIAMISGSMKPPEGYFVKHYKTRIDKAIQQGHKFICGAANGIDTQATDYLITELTKAGRNIGDITVYCPEKQDNEPKADPTYPEGKPWYVANSFMFDITAH